MRYQPAFPDKRISAAAAKAQLAMMLCNCRDDRLASFTAQGLACQYRVRLGDIETMLDNERERRRVRADG